MLSNENIEKLHMNGIYRHEPVPEWLPSYRRNDPYHGKNWTFKVVKYEDKYYMHDTYWSTGDDHPIELTDENINEFEYLFENDEVRFMNDYAKWLEYDESDRWYCGLDSAGKRFVVRRGASKIKELVVERLEREINTLKSDLASKQRILEGVRSGELNHNMY